MASDCTDIDVVLRQINQRLRKLEKSDSEKTEEIGRLNRVINQKDVEIHNLKTELASTKAELAVAKERIKELEEAADDTSSTPGKPEKNSSNSSIPSSQEDILATLYPWRCISGCFRQAIQKICHTKKREQLQEQSQENHLVLNKRRVDHRTVGGNPSLTQLLSRLSWTLQEL